jgi:predicted AlkP superfamily pyrophosphatase or phosphodiesterase
MSHRAIATVALVLLAASPACGDREEPERKAVAAPSEPASSPVTRPLLLLGIDGATWAVMDPLLKAGRLPNFSRLVERGVRAPLQTFEPTLSPLIWTTIATGFAPARHGIEGFTAPVAGGGETALVTSNMRKTKALWNVLPEHGRSVGVVGWWATYPAEEVDGFVISDQASTLRGENYRAALDLKGRGPEGPDPGRTWPAALAVELEGALTLPAKVAPEVLRRFLDLPPDRLAAVAGGELVDKEDIFSIFKFAFLIDRSFVESGLAAAAKRRPDALMIYLNGLDAAEHHFWKYREPERFAGVAPDDAARFGGVIDEYYIYMDEVLGRFLELYPLEESMVMVVSDHGHEANPGYDPASADHYDRVCSGGHEGAPDGIFILAGRDVAAGAEIARPNVFDIAPTVLAAMGAPVSGEMPGKVVRDALAPAFLKAHPVSRVKGHGPNPAYSPGALPSDMNETLKEKLKGLGYIQ